jgi:hypothetical protein
VQQKSTTARHIEAVPPYWAQDLDEHDEILERDIIVGDQERGRNREADCFGFEPLGAGYNEAGQGFDHLDADIGHVSRAVSTTQTVFLLISAASLGEKWLQAQPMEY